MDKMFAVHNEFADVYDYSCLICGASVREGYEELHQTWHNEVNVEVKPGVSILKVMDDEAAEALEVRNERKDKDL